MYGAGLPTLLFFILAVWGLKDEDITWLEAGIGFLIIAVSSAVILMTGSHPALIALPAGIVDVWLLYKLDLLNAKVR